MTVEITPWPNHHLSCVAGPEVEPTTSGLTDHRSEMSCSSLLKLYAPSSIDITFFHGREIVVIEVDRLKEMTRQYYVHA